VKEDVYEVIRGSTVSGPSSMRDGAVPDVSNVRYDLAASRRSETDGSQPSGPGAKNQGRFKWHGDRPGGFHPKHDGLFLLLRWIGLKIRRSPACRSAGRESKGVAFEAKKELQANAEWRGVD